MANPPERRAPVFKDEVLDRLAVGGANVAQFVSFSPNLQQRYCRVRSEPANKQFNSISDAVDAMIVRSPDRTVNVRSYQPESPKSREFVYGVDSGKEAAEHVVRLAAQGLFTIVNETIDVSDGGVSGVVHGATIEFSPDDTPRCVEKPGTAALAREHGMRLLSAVYGFEPNLAFPLESRVEFSIHPNRRGVFGNHTVIWEVEDQPIPPSRPQTMWPNRFSRLLGDKTFGLLIAWVTGLKVPRTVVVNRRVAPFWFGDSTGTGETWIRTAPFEQRPGKFTTKHGWADPFRLLAEEDPTGDYLASVLSQDGVDALASGAFTWVGKDDVEEVLVEGVSGHGDDFMLGRTKPEQLPTKVLKAVENTAHSIRKSLGLCRGEWVFDGASVWTVQLHRLTGANEPQVIVPGTPATYHSFSVAEGLEALRALVDSIANLDEGIELVGDVGITSHFGDVLRQARIPSRLAGQHTHM